MFCLLGYNDVNINKVNVVVEKKINNKRDFDCLFFYWLFYFILVFIFIFNIFNY